MEPVSQDSPATTAAAATSTAAMPAAAPPAAAPPAAATSVAATSAAATSAVAAPTTADPTSVPSASANASIQAPAKKDRKPRRQGLPLPDPIPDTPVKRYPEPSKNNLQDDIEQEDAKLQACFDRLNLTRSFYDQRQKIRDEAKPAYDAARKEFVTLNDQCRALFEERKTITTSLKAIKDADMAARSTPQGRSVDIPGVGKDGAEALKDIRTMEELENRIEDLEYRLETGSMPMAEEKRVVTQISFLNHKGRDYVRGRDQSFKNEQTAKDARVVSRRELEESRNSLDSRIDAAKAKLDTKKKAVEVIKEKEDEEVKKLQHDTPTIDRDEEKKTIAELKANVRKLRDQFQTNLDLWYLNEHIHFEQQKILKRKKYEAMQAEREAQRKAWEEEQAQYPEPHPYQAEKDLCSALTVYLRTLLGETTEKPTVILRASDGKSAAPSLKSNGAAREITSKGTAIGKGTPSHDSIFADLSFQGFVNKKSKKGRKDRRTSTAVGEAAAVTLEGSNLKTHAIDYLTAFTKLDIKPPNRLSEVRSALDAVESKASFYETAPAPTEEEKAERTKKSDSSKSKKGGGASSSSASMMNGDVGAAAFPGLGSEGGNAPSRARDVSLPSFMAVAKGDAAAPAPAPVMSVNTAVFTEVKGVLGEDEATAEATVEDDEVAAPTAETVEDASAKA